MTMSDHLNVREFEPEMVRHRALLEVSKAIAAHRDLHDLFHDLAQRLPQVVEVNFVALSLHDFERNLMSSIRCRPMCRRISSAVMKSPWTRRPPDSCGKPNRRSSFKTWTESSVGRR